MCREGFESDPKSADAACTIATSHTEASCDNSHEFQCKRSGTCIDKRLLCDGDYDCPDQSDEDTSPGGECEHVVCRKDQFACKTIGCVAHSWVCDGDRDCHDGSDEDPNLCHNSSCNANQFTCRTSGRCIPKAWECDLDHDCGAGDTSDEHEGCGAQKCTADEFTCLNEMCIPHDFKCDGDEDCRDGSDEADCEHPCELPDYFLCANDKAEKKKCLPLVAVCNGVPECSDGLDEKNCSLRQMSTVGRHVCESHEFDCQDGNFTAK